MAMIFLKSTIGSAFPKKFGGLENLPSSLGGNFYSWIAKVVLYAIYWNTGKYSAEMHFLGTLFFPLFYVFVLHKL